MKKLIIIPAYNEERSIMELYKEIRSKAADYDVIVVNDCSTDRTLQLCRENGIKVLDLPVNLGIGGAMQTGYRYAALHGYEVAAQVDGDGQHDPGFLKEMFRTLTEENADMVIGSRFLEKKGYQSTAFRRFGIRYFSALIRLLAGKTVTDPTSGFRMVKGGLIRTFAESYPQDYAEPESIIRLLEEGGKLMEIPVIMRERRYGSSSISTISSLYYLVKVTAAILLERI